MGSTQRQRGYNPQNRNRPGPGEGGGVRCGVLARGRGRGRCVTSEEVRLDRPASELADCGRPHASRGAALLERGGPLAGKGEVLGGQGLSLRIDLDCKMLQNATYSAPATVILRETGPRVALTVYTRLMPSQTVFCTLHAQRKALAPARRRQLSLCPARKPKGARWGPLSPHPAHMFCR